MNSQNKRTAFARVPRGKPKGPEVRSKTVINKAFIEQMNQAALSADVSTVLTKTDSSLDFSFQANSTVNLSVKQNGRTIGDTHDVSKIMNLGNFINDERKAILKTSVSSVAKRTMAAVVLVGRDPGFDGLAQGPITNIDKAFVDIYRVVNAQAEMLNKNVQTITDQPAAGHANELVKNHLIETSARIRGALGKFLLYRASTADEKPRKLNDFLKEECVMSWIFGRLTSQKLQFSGKDFEIRRVYFPKDPTKGLQITFKEWKDRTLIDNQGGILRGMGAYRGLWTDATVRSVCGIPQEWDLVNFADQANSLANVPLMVVPFHGAVTHEEHLSILDQNGDRGLPWQVGNTVTPMDTLRFIGTVPKRIAYGFVGMPRFSAPWYETMFPGFHFDPAVIEREGRSVFSQLKTQYNAPDTPVQAAYFDKVNGQLGLTVATRVIPPIIMAVMDIPPDSGLGRELVLAVTQNMAVIPNGETLAIVDAWSAISTRRDSISDALVEQTLSGVLTANLTSGGGKNKNVRVDDIRTARSLLSAEGGSLVRELRRRGYRALSERINQWLRSFLTAELQAAVSEVISARLEASLASPIRFGKGDTTVFIESAEFAEDYVPEDPAPAEGDDEEGDGDRTENPDDR